jgi:hypothetical protein
VVIDQIGHEEAVLHKADTSKGNVLMLNVIVAILLGISIVLILMEEALFYLWLLSAMLIYSYNFVILFVPSTSKGSIEQEKFSLQGEERQAVRQMIRKKGVMVQVGLTMFLGGLVALTPAFFVIFGIGLALTIYLGPIAGTIDRSLALAISIQIVLILSYTAFIIYLRPNAQGIGKVARRIKGSVDLARERGRIRMMITSLAIIGIVTLSAILVIGAMLLPGSTMGKIIEKMVESGHTHFLAYLFIFVVQFVTMRHLQAVFSRRMAVALLKERIGRMKADVLAPLEDMIGAAVRDDDRFKGLRHEFYSMAIYEIAWHDIFGSSPVYVIRPKVSNILDVKVLEDL